jgi:hypothetical protein
MAFLATLTAALKAVPQIVGLIRDDVDALNKLRDSVDDSQFEKFKAQLSRDTRRLQNAKTHEEVRAVIRSLNNP